MYVIKTLLRVFYLEVKIFLKCGFQKMCIEACREVFKYGSLGFHLGTKLIELESPLWRAPGISVYYGTSGNQNAVTKV